MHYYYRHVYDKYASLRRIYLRWLGVQRWTVGLSCIYNAVCFFTCFAFLARDVLQSTAMYAFDCYCKLAECYKAWTWMLHDKLRWLATRLYFLKILKKIWFKPTTSPPFLLICHPPSVGVLLFSMTVLPRLNAKVWKRYSVEPSVLSILLPLACHIFSHWAMPKFHLFTVVVKMLISGF